MIWPGQRSANEPISSDSGDAGKPSGRRSVSFLVTGTAFSQGVQFAASLFLARLYTPDEFGQYASILAIASVLGALITFSYPTAIPLAEDDEESRVVAWLSLGVAAASASLITVVLAAGVVAGVAAWGWRPDWQHLAFVPLTAWAIAVWGTLQFKQSRLSAFHRVALATSGGATTQVGTQLASGWAGVGAAGLSAGYLVGRLVNVAVLFRGARLGPPPALRRLRRSAVRWSEMPRWLLPTTVMNLLGTSALTPWVARQFGLGIAGSFAFAYQMLSVPAALVGQALATILFPRLAEADRGSGISPAAVESHVRRLSSVALPMFLPVLVLGPELFAVVFGNEWRQAGQIAAILSPYLAVSLVSSPISSIPIVKRRGGRILIVATLDTAARFTAIALGGMAGSVLTGFALYSAVGTLAVGGYLAWTLRLSGVSPASLLKRSWLAILLAMSSTAILLAARAVTSREVLVSFTFITCGVWVWIAIRSMR
jgi:O-antigen/teichoic acid export membrane protein